MAVEYKGITEDVNDATRTSITMQIPSEAAVGDLLICYISKDDDVAIYTTGDYANWNMLVNATAGTGNALCVAWRIATADDVSGAVSWTWNGDSEDYYGCILCYSGADTTNPIHASDYTAQGTANDTPIAPSVAFGDPTPLTAGSLVLQVFGADDNDIPYIIPSQLTQRFKNNITDTGGAGGDKVSRWTSPTGFNDPDTAWADETNAYDDCAITYATGNADHYLELTHASIYCSKVRIYLSIVPTNIDIDVYYSDDWHNIFSGVVDPSAYIEKEIGSNQLVTAMRIKGNSATVFLVEADFWELVEGSGNTGTAVFSMNASEQWVAATVIIEAASTGLINGYFMQNGAKEEKFGYFMNSSEEFGYYMYPLI